MKKLDLEIKTNGRTYRQIKRNEYKAMYLSNDGYYEVFNIHVIPPGEIFGKYYPERESYPSTEEFGVRAWCTKNKERAEEIYNNIVEKKKLTGKKLNR